MKERREGKKYGKDYWKPEPDIICKRGFVQEEVNLPVLEINATEVVKETLA